MGRPLSPFMPPVERFWARVPTVDSNQCWPWTGNRNGADYGIIIVSRARIRAHRFSYELHHGPITDGQVVRHKCDNPPCVNPAHLELGTPADNVHDTWERGRATQGAFNRVKTHCPAEHEYTPENTYIDPRDGGRACRACRLLASQRYRERRRAA